MFKCQQQRDEIEQRFHETSPSEEQTGLPDNLNLRRVSTESSVVAECLTDSDIFSSICNLYCVVCHTGSIGVTNDFKSSQPCDSIIQHSLWIIFHIDRLGHEN